MSRMIDALILVIAFRHLALSSAKKNVTQSVFVNTGNDDLIFNDYVMVDFLARTQLDCARRCQLKNKCDAFTFVKGSPMTSAGFCRLNSVFCGSGSSSASIGARTYAKKRRASGWLGKACVFSSDCPGNYTSCHVGQCLCQPAAYYSNGADVCMQSCQQSDLGSTFLTYNKTDINYDDYNYLYMDDGNNEIDARQCQRVCVNNPQCHSVVFGADSEYSYENCWPVLAFNDTGQTTSSENWTLYKITCA